MDGVLCQCFDFVSQALIKPEPTAMWSCVLLTAAVLTAAHAAKP
jgi:hypothetical protein